MRSAEILGVTLGGAALTIAIAALLNNTTTVTTPVTFSTNLVPTLPNSFTVGSSQKGVSGVWMGAQPELFTYNSTTDRIMFGNDSYTTYQDLSSYSRATASINPSYGGFYSSENQYMGHVTASAGIASQSSLFYNYATARSSDVICSVSKPSTGGNSVSGDSRIYLMTSGTYRISTSIQFDQTANAVTPVAIWLAVNGTSVAESGSLVTIQQASGETIPFVEFLIPMSASQYFEIKWNSFNTTSWAAHFSTADGVGSTSGANVPSVITNVFRVA